MEGPISSIFGSDNPFKFFFLSGITLLVIGLYYPFEKRQELDLKKNEVEFSDSTLVMEIINMSEELDELNEESDGIISLLDSLELERGRSKDPVSVSEKIKLIRVESQEKFRDIERKKDALDLKIVSNRFNRKEIEIYESHLKEVRWYSRGFILVGVILLFYGGYKWLTFFKKNNR